MAKETLDTYQQQAVDMGQTKVSSVLAYGSPKNIIAKELPKEYNIDLIMLGATGLNAVERLFIGSVSESVIRNASCDVLVVRTDLDNKLPKMKKNKDKELSQLSLLIVGSVSSYLPISTPVRASHKVCSFNYFRRSTSRAIINSSSVGTNRSLILNHQLR